MSFNNRLRNLFIATLFVLFLIPCLVSSQISLTIGDTSGNLGEKLVPLDITISNVSDTIAGFQIWLQLSSPDLVTFQKETVLSTYLYDSSSFIVPSWTVDVKSLSGLGTDLLITGSSFLPPHIIPPQNDSLLIRVYFEVTETLPTPPYDSVVNIILQTTFTNHFSFSKPSGESLGLTLIEYLDSTCYECLQWDNSTCLSWAAISLGDPSLCDSISTQLDTTFVLNETYWSFTNGIFTLMPSCGYTAGSYDIGNLVALVSFMFDSGTTITLSEADYNCDCAIDIGDLVGFVSYMFQGGAAPGCTTQQEI